MRATHRRKKIVAIIEAPDGHDIFNPFEMGGVLLKAFQTQGIDVRICGDEEITARETEMLEEADADPYCPYK